MNISTGPTPYADVNAVLREFLCGAQVILGENFYGMYLDGSLALGDFDPRSSDIDYVVVTNALVSEQQFEALRDLHARFNGGTSPWATEVEAVYIPRDMLRRGAPIAPWVPRIERGAAESLVKARLDSSWIIHWHILREHTRIVAGPDPRPLIDPITPDDFRRVMRELAPLWQEWVRTDPDAVRHRGSQVYMVRTLCRMLYTLDHGAVVSKPVAARWARHTLGERWAALIERAINWRKDPGEQDAPSEQEIEATRALLEYTMRRCGQPGGAAGPAPQP